MNEVVVPKSLAIGAIDLPTVSIVIPTLNEAKNLEFVLPRIPPWVHEILIVDGLSTDGTPEVARALNPKVSVVLEQRRGKGSALRAGFHAAKGDIIIMLDADGSMNPAEITLFVAALVAGADFVKGSRFVQGGGTSDMSVLRMFGNWGLTQVVRVIYGGSFSDLCYGYIGFWKRHLPVLNIDCDGFEVETALNLSAMRAGFKISEVPSFENLRVFGESHLNTFSDGFRVLKTILTEWMRPAKVAEVRNV